MNSQLPYEPAERDPVAIRRTVIILVLLMLIGGFFIFYKYRENLALEHEEDKKGRSARSLGNVKNNFQTKSTDGTVYDFTLLEGKLTLMTVISAKLPEQSRLLVNEMRKAQAHFKEKEEMQFVCLSADTLDSVSLEELGAFAKEVGAEGDNWYILASDSDEFGGYVKDVLKLGMTSRVNKETKERELPDFLRIVDPSLDIRGEIDDFKFKFYHDIEERTRVELLEKPSLLEDKSLKKKLEFYQNAVKVNREKMYKNISYILEYENTDVAALKAANRSNRYHTPLIVFSGFILFILIMGYRLKMQRKKEALANKR